jgi:hypothetical protein
MVSEDDRINAEREPVTRWEGFGGHDSLDDTAPPNVSHEHLNKGYKRDLTCK